MIPQSLNCLLLVAVDNDTVAKWCSIHWRLDHDLSLIPSLPPQRFTSAVFSNVFAETHRYSLGDPDDEILPLADVKDPGLQASGE